MYLLTAGHRLTGSSVLWLHPLHVLPGWKMSSIFKICLTRRIAGAAAVFAVSVNQNWNDVVVTQLPPGCVCVCEGLYVEDVCVCSLKWLKCGSSRSLTARVSVVSGKTSECLWRESCSAAGFGSWRFAELCFLGFHVQAWNIIVLSSCVTVKNL